MNKVFVAQYSDKINFRLAESYGEVVFLSDKEFRAEPAVAEANSNIKLGMERKLADYIVGVDHILVTGSPIPIFIIGAFLSRRPGIHKILKWNNQLRDYDLVKLKID